MLAQREEEWYRIREEEEAAAELELAAELDSRLQEEDIRVSGTPALVWSCVLTCPAHSGACVGFCGPSRADWLRWASVSLQGRAQISEMQLLRMQRGCSIQGPCSWTLSPRSFWKVPAFVAVTVWAEMRRPHQGS